MIAMAARSLDGVARRLPVAEVAVRQRVVPLAVGIAVLAVAATRIPAQAENDWLLPPQALWPRGRPE